MDIDRSPSDNDVPDVTVIIVNYNAAHLLDRMFAALYAARNNLQLQVIVVDNASKDNSVDLLSRHYPEARLIENETNVGFGRANNQALESARGRYILLLNTDAFISPDTLVKTVGFMNENLPYGILGVRLVGEDGSTQPSCRFFPTPWNLFLNSSRLKNILPKIQMVDDPTWNEFLLQECDWVPGCYYLIRRDLIEQIGLFDPRYFLYYEEVDHCKMARNAGWRVVYYPHTTTTHIGGESAKSVSTLSADRQISGLHIESELLYMRKHFGIKGLIAYVILTGLSAILRVIKSSVPPFNKAKRRLAAVQIKNLLKFTKETRIGRQATR